jgi:hypothetical protein
MSACLSDKQREDIIDLRMNIFKGLSNMCNIAHVKATKSSNFLYNNYLIKNYTFNLKCTSSNTNLLF